MTTRTNRQAGLALPDGQYDPPRIGWWLVTGPQPEHDAYAVIEFSWVYPKQSPRHEGYVWYLHRREKRPRPYRGTYLGQVAAGVGLTRDEAFRQLTRAWTEHLGLN